MACPAPVLRKPPERASGEKGIPPLLVSDRLSCRLSSGSWSAAEKDAFRMPKVCLEGEEWPKLSGPLLPLPVSNIESSTCQRDCELLTSSS